MCCIFWQTSHCTFDYQHWEFECNIESYGHASKFLVAMAVCGLAFRKWNLDLLVSPLVKWMEIPNDFSIQIKPSFFWWQHRVSSRPMGQWDWRWTIHSSSLWLGILNSLSVSDFSSHRDLKFQLANIQAKKNWVYVTISRISCLSTRSCVFKMLEASQGESASWVEMMLFELNVCWQFVDVAAPEGPFEITVRLIPTLIR